MKNISVNKLQDNLSKIVKEVEKGERFEISRYSKPVAYLISKNDLDTIVAGQECKRCIDDLRKIAHKVKK